MANRIRGNVIIVDSASISLDFPGASNTAQIGSIAFWSSNSTGLMEFSFQNNTADIIIKMQAPVNQPNTTTFRFPSRIYLKNLRVNTLTVGTGFIYLR